MSSAFSVLIDEMNQESMESLQKPFKVIMFVMDRPAMSNILLRDILYKMIAKLWKSTKNLADMESIEKVWFFSYAILYSMVGYYYCQYILR
jgi:hypothetical protein